MPRRHKRNPFSDEDRNYVDVKLVNFTGIEERGNQLSEPAGATSIRA
jgi:hypothetical protein